MSTFRGGIALAPNEMRFDWLTYLPFVRSDATQSGPGSTFDRLKLGVRLNRFCPSDGRVNVGV